MHISSWLHSFFLSGSRTAQRLFRPHSFSMGKKANTVVSEQQQDTDGQHDPCCLWSTIWPFFLKQNNRQHFGTLSNYTTVYRGQFRRVAEKQHAYYQCFCRSGCRFSFPAEECVALWTARLWISVQRVSLVQKWRKNSGQGAEVQGATEEPWGEAWIRCVVGGEGSPEGASLLSENCRGS